MILGYTSLYTFPIDIFMINVFWFIIISLTKYHLKEELINIDKTISGFNLGVNDGLDAGQTIFHCHVHLIPRRKNDVDDPRGGVRGVIPLKQKY